MSELTADQALFLLQNVYLGSLKNESRVTRKVLEAVPADKCQHRPDPVSKSAIELVRHIAVAENRFLETVIDGVFDVNAAALPDTVKTPQEIASWYEQLAKMVDFRGLFERPAVSFALLAMVHTIHHRGQLSSYLRSMGAKVPSIYGESYDDAQARKAVGG